MNALSCPLAEPDARAAPDVPAGLGPVAFALAFACAAAISAATPRTSAAINVLHASRIQARYPGSAQR
jgi:hypothetical protein